MSTRRTPTRSSWSVSTPNGSSRARGKTAFCPTNSPSSTPTPARLTTLIIYPKNGQRISLEHGLTRALLKARRENVIDKVPRRFIIAGHFTRADLTTFADFGYFKRRIGAVRKSYATTEMPLQLRLASNEGPVRCSAVIIDTMMLAPAGTSARNARQPAGRAQDRSAGGVFRRTGWTCSCGTIPSCSRNTR